MWYDKYTDPSTLGTLLKLRSLLRRNTQQDEIELRTNVSHHNNAAIIDKVIFDEDGRWAQEVAKDIHYVATRHAKRTKVKGDQFQLIVILKAQLFSPEQWREVNKKLAELCDEGTLAVLGHRLFSQDPSTNLSYAFRERTP